MNPTLICLILFLTEPSTQEADSGAPVLLMAGSDVAPGGDSEGWKAALSVAEETLGEHHRVKQVSLTSLGAPTVDPRFQLMRALDVEVIGVLATYEPVTGVLKGWAFDNRTGRSSHRGAKVRSVMSELSEDHRLEISRLFGDLLEELRERKDLPPRVPPRENDSRLSPGFIWKFEGLQTVVDDVYARTEIAESGLEAGDVVVEVDERKVSTPAEFGLSIGKLRDGDTYEILVKRVGKSLTCRGRVEEAAKIRSRWEETFLDRELPSPIAERFKFIEGKASLIAVVSGRSQEDWDDLYGLDWLVQKSEGKLELRGVARLLNEHELSGWKQRHPFSGLWFADPEGEIAFDLGVDQEPRFLFVDEEGVVRYRCAAGGDLHLVASQWLQKKD